MTAGNERLGKRGARRYASRKASWQGFGSELRRCNLCRIQIARKATMMDEPKDRKRGPRRHVVFDGEITLIPPDGSEALLRPSGVTVTASGLH